MGCSCGNASDCCGYTDDGMRTCKHCHEPIQNWFISEQWGLVRDNNRTCEQAPDTYPDGVWYHEPEETP